MLGYPERPPADERDSRRACGARPGYAGLVSISSCAVRSRAVGAVVDGADSRSLARWGFRPTPSVSLARIARTTPTSSSLSGGWYTLEPIVGFGAAEGSKSVFHGVYQEIDKVPISDACRVNKSIYCAHSLTGGRVFGVRACSWDPKQVSCRLWPSPMVAPVALAKRDSGATDGRGGDAGSWNSDSRPLARDAMAYVLAGGRGSP